MSGFGNRLAKLERAATAELANCAGCLALPARFIVAFSHRPAPPELNDPVRVRCDVCGRERRGDTIVMRLVGPKDATAA